jgi:predicted nucleic acid-binding protein
VAVKFQLDTNAYSGLMRGSEAVASRVRIPSNDIWIAAHALETGADLLSFDEHFSCIEGLAFVHLRD